MMILRQNFAMSRSKRHQNDFQASDDNNQFSFDGVPFPFGYESHNDVILPARGVNLDVVEPKYEITDWFQIVWLPKQFNQH